MHMRYLGCVLLLWLPGMLHAQKRTEQPCHAPTLTHGYFVPEQEMFSHDAKLTYACSKGHKPAVEGWWATSTCQDGTWSPEPNCIDEKSCFAAEIPNAEYTANTAGWYEEGDWIDVKCTEGYEAKNLDDKADCLDGTWLSPPICERSAHACAELPHIPHAVIIHQRYQEVFAAGSEVQYECEHGFTADGADAKKSISCVAGNWTEGPACSRGTRPGGGLGGPAVEATGGGLGASAGSGRQSAGQGSRPGAGGSALGGTGQTPPAGSGTRPASGGSRPGVGGSAEWGTGGAQTPPAGSMTRPASGGTKPGVGGSAEWGTGQTPPVGSGTRPAVAGQGSRPGAGGSALGGTGGAQTPPAGSGTRPASGGGRPGAGGSADWGTGGGQTPPAGSGTRPAVAGTKPGAGGSAEWGTGQTPPAGSGTRPAGGRPGRDHTGSLARGQIPSAGSGTQPAGGGSSSTDSEKDTEPEIIKTINCGRAPSVPNGDTVETHDLHLKYQCSLFYKLVGPETVVCYSNGTWSEAPTCKDAYCRVNTDNYVQLESAGVKFIRDGESVLLDCKKHAWSLDRFSRALCTNGRLSFTPCCTWWMLRMNSC